MIHEPARLEIFLTKLAFFFTANPSTRRLPTGCPLSGMRGCLTSDGMGTVAYYTARRLTDGHLTCIDISERWLKICRKTLRVIKMSPFSTQGPRHSPRTALTWSIAILFCMILQTASWKRSSLLCEIP